MNALLGLRVRILRYLLNYNDQAERKQEPAAPQPTFIRTISSGSSTRKIRLDFYIPPDFGTSDQLQRGRHPVVVDFHRGGFTAGLPLMDARWAQALISTRVRPIVVSVDYSLAPENPFPAALEDATAAILWLAHEGAAEYNLDPERMVLTGFGAGGTLALKYQCGSHRRRRTMGPLEPTRDTYLKARPSSPIHPPLSVVWWPSIPESIFSCREVHPRPCSIDS